MKRINMFYRLFKAKYLFCIVLLCALTLPAFAQQKTKAKIGDQNSLENMFYFIEQDRISLQAEHNEPTDILLKDLDKDELDDIIVCSQADHIISFYLNLGSQKFSKQHIISDHIENVNGIAAGDIDNDGDIDIFAISATARELYFFESISDTSYADAVLVRSGFAYNQVELADANNDGFLDIITSASATGTLIWYENMQDGTFSTGSVISAGLNNIQSFVVKDIDKDLDVDIIAASTLKGQIVYFQNTGNGFFNAEQRINSNAIGVNQVLTADIDQDGDLDLVASLPNAGNIIWHENLGSGNFANSRIITTKVGGFEEIQVSDLDGDGDIDILAADSNTDHLSWYENLEDDTFGPEQIISDLMPAVSRIRSSDLNNDGLMDVVGASLSTDRIAFFPNIAGRRFNNFQDIAKRAMAYYPIDIIASDLNVDGDIDVLVASADDNKLAWYENKKGVFSKDSLLQMPINNISAITLLDLDEDRDNDIVIGTSSSIYFIPNAGRGRFADTLLLANALSGVSDIVGDDFDLDGDNDLVVAAYDEDRLYYFQNQGTAAFSPPVVLGAALDGVKKIVLVDLDQDNDKDLVVVNELAGTVVWLEYQNGVGFGAPQTLVSSVVGVVDVIVEDMNSDSDLDLVLATNTGYLSYYENNGSQSFSFRAHLDQSLAQQTSVHYADLDGDGDYDILNTSALDNTVAWYENSVGTFGPRQAISEEARGAHLVTTADIDGDGVMDVLSASTTDDKVVWYKNYLAQFDGSNRRPVLSNPFKDLTVDAAIATHVVDSLSHYFTDPDLNPLKYAVSTELDTMVLASRIKGDSLVLDVKDETQLPDSTLVTVTATDGNLSLHSYFKLYVNRVNNPPTGVKSFSNQTFMPGWGQFIVEDLSSYFSDPDGDEISITIGSSKASEISAKIENNRLVLDEVTGFAGTTKVTIRATDGEFVLYSEISITVNQPNRAPLVITTFTDREIETGSTLNLGALAGFFRDPDNDALTYEVSFTNPIMTSTLSASNWALSPVDANTAGKTTVSITASDGEFNVSQSFDVWVRLKASSFSYPTSALAVQRATTIRWAAVDGANTQRVRVLSISGTDTTVAFTTGAIAATQVESKAQGLAYGTSYTLEHIAYDADGNAGKTRTSTFSTVNAPSAPTDTIAIQINLPDTLITENYSLYSLPGNYETIDASVFFASAGKQGKQWDAYTQVDSVMVKHSNSNPASFKPGSGLWFINADTVNYKYLPEAPILDDDDLYHIPVKAGWNIISSPFVNEQISWVLTKSVSGIPANANIWKWQKGTGVWSSTVSTLAPYEAYYYYADVDGEIVLPHGARLIETASSKEIPTEKASIEIRDNLGISQQIYVEEQAASSTQFIPESGFERLQIAFKNKQQQLIENQTWRAEANKNELLSVAFYAKAKEDAQIHIPASIWKTTPEWVEAMNLYNASTGKWIAVEPNKALDIKMENKQEEWQIFIGTKEALLALEEEMVPSQVEIEAAYPNPFNPSTNIVFRLNKASQVEVKVFNIIGQRVATLDFGIKQSGSHQFQWDASSLASGVYFMRIELNGGQQYAIQKLSLIK